MNDLYSIDFTRSLPPSLKSDAKMIALANSIAKQLHITAQEIKKNVIYARIEELPENVLDILSYDLHVDWYDYTYPIEAKRAIIKDSVKVQKRLGTKYAVETALGNIHPNSSIEEWFEYAGEPFYFRVVLDTTHSRAPAGYFVVKKAIDMYKRLTAHMESLIYQCQIGLVVETGSDRFGYKSGMTGKIRSGTQPKRSTRAGITHGGLEIEAESAEYRYRTPAAGMKPYRSTIAALEKRAVQIEAKARGFPYTSGMTGRITAGTETQRNRRAGIAHDGLEVEAASSEYGYHTPTTGTGPRRTTESGTQSGAFISTATAEGFIYKAKRCGTSRCKS